MSEEIKYQLKANESTEGNIIEFEIDRDKKIINVSAVSRIEKDTTTQLGTKENILSVRYDSESKTHFLYVPDSINEDEVKELLKSELEDTTSDIYQTIISMIENNSSASDDLMTYGTIDDMAESTSKFFVLIDDSE